VTPTVVVIGGGIVGAATAWSLAREGVDVLLLEARRFGGQSTGKSAAIVRCHYSNPEVVRMALHSRETLRRLPLLLDCDPVYERTGWLFLVDEHDAQVALRNAEMQEEEGVDNLDVEDLDDYLPGIDPTGIAYALYEPSSGFADPVATTKAYIAALRRLGGEARELAMVEAIEVEHGRVRGVRVSVELLACEIAVLAAGPWSRGLARTAGIELPLEITREQDVVFATEPGPTISCAVSSQVDRVYMRPAPEQGKSRLLAGRGFPKEYERAEPDRYEESVDDAFERDLRARVTGRLPGLAGMRAVGGRVGLYDVTPDWHPILGPAGDPENLVLATGGSGHCFKLAPAIGELVAAQILGRSLAYADAASFSLERFAAGREFASTYGGNRA
jgi:glycine/D-amino acid oxidase-like deaminating enzyme